MTEFHAGAVEDDEENFFSAFVEELQSALRTACLQTS